MSESQRDPVINAFRGMAIIGVIWHHATNAGRNALIASEGDSIYIYVINSIISSGWRGVHLFFVLSGFVLTASYSRLIHSGLDCKYYYKRRAARLLPIYYIALLILICYRLGGTDIGKYFSNLLFWGSFAYVFIDPSPYADLGIPGTSLGYEIVFSLAVPLVMRIYKKIGAVWLLIAYSMIAYAATSGSVYVWVRGINPSLTWTCTTIFHCMYFFWGILVYDLYVKYTKKTDDLPSFITIPAMISGLTVALFCTSTPLGPANVFFKTIENGYFFSSTLFIAGMSLSVFAALFSRGAMRWILTNRFLQLVGMMCYSLFIWHVSFLVAFQTGTPHSNVATNSVGILMMLIFCFLSYRYIEFPYRRLRELLPVRHRDRRGAATTPSPAGFPVGADGIPKASPPPP